MADSYDRRPRGGGGRGGFNAKRRRYNDDDDLDRRGPPRRRHDAQPFPRIRRQLLGLAESAVRKWHQDAVETAQIVADHWEDDYVNRGFVDLTCQLAVEQPFKTPFVAAVVLVANTMRSEIAAAVLAKAARDLEDAVGRGEWREAKLLLKFLACLQSCLEGEGVFPILDALFDRAVDLQTASSDDTIGTELVKIILLTIPYVMAAAPGQWAEKAAELMDKTEIIASEPHPMQKLVDPYVFDPNDENSSQPSLIALLQKQLQAEAAGGWIVDCIPRPWKMPLEEVEHQSKLDDCPKHALPAVMVPENIVTGSRDLFPEVYFSVYSGQDIDSVPQVTNIAASLIRDAILDTINILHYNRNFVARTLIDVDCFFNNGTFVKRATPFDRLRDIEQGRSTWKPEDMVVDTVFSQLFQLPAPEHKLVYYHSVLYETCKVSPAAIAPSLGRAIRSLYRNGGRLDLELNHRFVDWFSHHLSNFGFTWKWTEWVDDVKLPMLHPHKAFILAALDKEIRLSFAQRIKNTVPDEYKPLISAEKEMDVPVFKFAKDDVPFARQGREMVKLLKSKVPDEEIQPLIEQIQNEAVDQGRDPLVSSTDVFMTAVLAVGSKSLSHVLACIERVKDRLLDSGSASAAARTQIMAAVMSYWSAHPGVALSIVEKLLNYAILTPQVVAEWAVSGEASDEARLAHAYLYELVLNTVIKVSGRARQIVAQQEAAKPAADGDLAMTDASNGDGPDHVPYADTPEAKDLRELFQLIESAVKARSASSVLAAAGDPLARQWVDRWLRAFQRRAAVEENFFVEAEKNRKRIAAAAAEAAAHAAAAAEAAAAAAAAAPTEEVPAAAAEAN
ncbi:cap binding protein [Gaeumannomyces tritici R3-111a-1]|uniref:Cap binding protein n=1 Tax=Gaeumannomyces tritici (strain R3-111a-1) TaxID=644352 RepID=J3P394_GAET3|nr:cap binding protein [Gaeumannomyces tritici R3-111a-1]EJT74136.1 cap binding protein [Gaeumannomyces tritici R3-111a-1]